MRDLNRLKTVKFFFVLYAFGKHITKELSSIKKSHFVEKGADFNVHFRPVIGRICAW